MPRRRKTTDAKIRAGTYRPSNARDVVELPPGRPAAPKWLDPVAKAEFDRVAHDLSAAGVLAKCHRSTLVIYACLWAEFEQAHGKVPTPRLSELRRLAAELGISPRSGTVAPVFEEPGHPRNVTPIRNPEADRRRSAELSAILAGIKRTSLRREPPAETPPPPPEEPKP